MRLSLVNPLEIFSDGTNVIDGVDFVTLFQSFRFSVAAWLNRDDVTLVANHLHVPAILEGITSARWYEGGVGIIEVGECLGDDSEDLILMCCLLDLLFGLFEPGLDIDASKGRVVIVPFEIVLDFFKHQASAVTFTVDGNCLSRNS